MRFCGDVEYGDVHAIVNDIKHAGDQWTALPTHRFTRFQIDRNAVVSSSKIFDKGDEFCKVALDEIKKVRMDILNGVQKNSRELIQNLYEEQGEMRFDSSNRLFLVLVDSGDFDNSWKLKRNLDALRPAIKDYLDSFRSKNIDDLKISFKYKSKTQEFKAISDAIFVVK